MASTSKHKFMYLFQESAKDRMILLPITSVDDCAQSENEKIDVQNFFQGVIHPLFLYYL